MENSDVFSRIESLSDEKIAEIAKFAEDNLRGKKFIPIPGDQSAAYFSEADILLFGGEPGGSKTGLLIGLALNEHERSLLVRKQFSDLDGFVDNAKGLVGTTEGFVGGTRPRYNKPDGGVIHFEGMSQDEGIDTSKQGTPHDFIGVDEGAQLPEDSIRMLLGWNRTNKKGQRCRMVIATNPPTDTVGDWMAFFFAPWLDPAHPNPAKYGELRYFIINENGESEEVPSNEPVIRNGEKYAPHSRTYIPAHLENNPYINTDDYKKRLQAMPEPYRSILLSGNFMMARRDDAKQVIPTAWIRAAQDRWTERPPEGVPMTAMGVDCAQGGDDNSVISWRHDCWFAPLLVEKGIKTPTGSETAGMIVSKRRNDAHLVVDVGGGYGGAVLLRLNDNGIIPESFNGVSTSGSRTRDGKLKFFNRRAAAWWKLRELLDPDQEGGSPAMLPKDPQLLSDLAAPRFEITSRGIQIEDKKQIKKRLGRSPDKGDSVVMCYNEGKVKLGNNVWRSGRKNTGNMPKVVQAYANRKTKR